MLTVPLSPREGEVIGVIQLLNAQDPKTGAVIPFPKDLIEFVEALAAQAAVAIENQNLIEAQKQLMDALIKLIAGAVDAKSPYTGGHCERVPELGIMLAEAANAQTEGPLADFKFVSEDEWREFRIGAWLHDCGKVTTPEYVVDKACKLETIYNRIHEVRMRFEVLWRDARISQLEALAQGGEAAEAQAAFDARLAQLQDDFAFVAECNVGGEFMAPDKVERLKSIAEATWLRHFDDRAGLAHEELKRFTGAPESLPVTEKLLSDKPQHIIPRTSTAVADPKWNFKVKVPEHLYNYGEIYNLGVSRGTLTEEERFKINEHVMQSLIMLEQLPLPKNLRRVPEYAGTHHETLVGSGYPRKLSEEHLSVPMRIMAIADVFEALTASDRPYKKAKTLSESIKILSFFKKDKHIDPVLFDLFLTSGVYKRYAEKFLLPEQIDEVDISKFVG
jgi:HD-GYP domain-containing protein (c-di-GMP phosphodiesterase class II)